MMQTTHYDDYTLTYDGFDFKLFIPDYWVKIYRGQKREPLYHDYCQMLELLKKVDKDRWVLDIGVNHGLFAVPASKLGYKVIGFEPVAENIETIELAREANGLNFFNIFRYALSNKNGEIDIYVPECPDNASLSQQAAISNMRGKDFRVEKVPTIKFDDWIYDIQDYFNIGFIKMDVQGAEYMVIEGAKEFLTFAKNITMIVEYEHHLINMGYTFQQLDDLIMSCGFQYQGQLSANDKIWKK